VIHCGKRQVGPADFAAGCTQSVERLRRGDFMQQVKVDVDDGRLVIWREDKVRLPEFLEE
jgi:hypothetical protein